MPPPREPRHHDFPSTRWSRILAQPGPRDLQALAEAYWPPMRAWLAARLRRSPADAEDLAQEAFAWLLATRFFDRADPARGRFRGLLKKTLAHFAIEHLRKQGAQKRGGDRAHEPLDGEHEHADPKSPTPDQVLDEAWRRQLLQTARQQLEQELVAGGRQRHWLLFRDYFLDEAPDGGDPDTLDYGALAARYGITKTDVSNWLDHGKRRYRELLRALVQETVSGEDELQEELRWLFGTAGPRGAGGR